MQLRLHGTPFPEEKHNQRSAHPTPSLPLPRLPPNSRPRHENGPGARPPLHPLGPNSTHRHALPLNPQEKGTKHSKYRRMTWKRKY